MRILLMLIPYLGLGALATCAPMPDRISGLPFRDICEICDGAYGPPAPPVEAAAPRLLRAATLHVDPTGPALLGAGQ